MAMASSSKRPRRENLHELYILTKEVCHTNIYSFKIMVHEAKGFEVKPSSSDTDMNADAIYCIKMDDIFAHFNCDRKRKSECIQQLYSIIDHKNLIAKLHDGSYAIIDDGGGAGGKSIFDFLIANNFTLRNRKVFLMDIDECAAVKVECPQIIAALQQDGRYFESTCDNVLLKYGLRLHLKALFFTIKSAGFDVFITTKAVPSIAQAFHHALGLSSEILIFSRSTFGGIHKSLSDMEKSLETPGFDRKDFTDVYILDDNPFNFLTDILSNENIVRVRSCPIIPLNKISVATDSYFKYLVDNIKDM